MYSEGCWDDYGWVVLFLVLRCVLLWRLQFERTLIIAEDDSEVSYLEGCTAPSYDSNQVLLLLLFLPPIVYSVVSYAVVLLHCVVAHVAWELMDKSPISILREKGLV